MTEASIVHSQFTIQEQSVISHAIAILNQHFKSKQSFFSSPTSVKNFLRLEMETEYREVFAVCFLNTQHQLIKFSKLFFGDLNQAPVHIGIIAKEALLLNSKCLILCHNHPTGDSSPSTADIQTTNAIKKALELLSISILDHIIIGHNDSICSFSEMGLI
ncbi:MAG: hypothetical protein HKM04_05175 [Legionellales bacterium]|nr:hypothetical protein [Legionellales bacterium]